MPAYPPEVHTYTGTKLIIGIKSLELIMKQFISSDRNFVE